MKAAAALIKLPGMGGGGGDPFKDKKKEEKADSDFDPWKA
jgi:hypothetical protein